MMTSAETNKEEMHRNLTRIYNKLIKLLINLPYCFIYDFLRHLRLDIQLKIA